MLRALVMRAGNEACVMACRPSGAMHRARYDGIRRAAQRRDPRRKKNNGQIDGEQSAHHDCQSTSICSRRNARQKPRYEENQESKAQLERC